MNNDFEATTAGINVKVRVFYLADESRPASGHFVWAYRVTVTNNSPVTVQLLRRTWRITDAHGRTQMVHGEGVVGEQPKLEPGESFEYTSGTPLATASGFMTGAYHMVRTHGACLPTQYGGARDTDKPKLEDKVARQNKG